MTVVCSPTKENKLKSILFTITLLLGFSSAHANEAYLEITCECEHNIGFSEFVQAELSYDSIIKWIENGFIKKDSAETQILSILEEKVRTICHPGQVVQETCETVFVKD